MSNYDDKPSQKVVAGARKNFNTNNAINWLDKWKLSGCVCWMTRNWTRNGVSTSLRLQEARRVDGKHAMLDRRLDWRQLWTLNAWCLPSRS